MYALLGRGGWSGLLGTEARVLVAVGERWGVVAAIEFFSKRCTLNRGVLELLNCQSIQDDQ